MRRDGPAGAPPWLGTVRLFFPRYGQHADEFVFLQHRYKQDRPGATQFAKFHDRRETGQVGRLLHDIDDMGVAVELSGRPPGWRAAAERTVREMDWNINRDGVVQMQTLEGRDVDWFVRRTGEVSLAVLQAILDVEE